MEGLRGGQSRLACQVNRFHSRNVNGKTHKRERGKKRKKKKLLEVHLSAQIRRCCSLIFMGYIRIFHFKGQASERTRTRERCLTLLLPFLPFFLPRQPTRQPASQPSSHPAPHRLPPPSHPSQQAPIRAAARPVFWQRRRAEKSTQPRLERRTSPSPISPFQARKLGDSASTSRRGSCGSPGGPGGRPCSPSHLLLVLVVRFGHGDD